MSHRDDAIEMVRGAYELLIDAYRVWQATEILLCIERINDAIGELEDLRDYSKA